MACGFGRGAAGIWQRNNEIACLISRVPYAEQRYIQVVWRATQSVNDIVHVAHCVAALPSYICSLQTAVNAELI